MLFNGALANTDGELGPGRNVGYALQVLKGGKVTTYQRAGALQLPTGIGQNRLFAFQRGLIIAVAHLFRADLRLKIGHLGFRLGQYWLNIQSIQSHQQFTGIHPLPLRHWPFTNATGQSGNHRHLLWRHHLAVKRQHRCVSAWFNDLNLHPPTAFGGTHLCRLRASHFQEQETQNTDCQNNYGYKSFGHRVLASQGK